MKSKKVNHRNTIIILIVIAILVLTNVYLLVKNYTPIKSEEIKQDSKLFANLSDNPLSTAGYTKVNIKVDNTTLLIEGNCTIMGLVPNELQTYSIKQGLDKSIEIRPTVHDITTNILEHFNISIILVKLTDEKDGVYFSNIYLKKDNQLLSIDSKPSDAIAIALRTNTHIYVRDTIISKFGQKTC